MCGSDDKVGSYEGRCNSADKDSPPVWEQSVGRDCCRVPTNEGSDIRYGNGCVAEGPYRGPNTMLWLLDAHIQFAYQSDYLYRGQILKRDA